MTKPRRIKLAQHLAVLEKRKMYTGFWWGNRKEKLSLIDLIVDKRIILKFLLRKYDEIA